MRKITQFYDKVIKTEQETEILKNLLQMAENKKINTEGHQDIKDE